MSSRLIRHSQRIVHLTTAHSWNDIRIFRKECRSLAAAGYDVTIVCPNNDSFCQDGVRIQGVNKPNSKIGRMIGTTVQVCTAALPLRADLYHFHDPELMTAAMSLKSRGAKVIYDSHEDVREQVLNKQWIPSWARAPISWGIGLVEDRTARTVDAIIAATPHISRRFPSSKVTVINNYALGAETLGSTVDYCERPPVAAYVGNISRIRGAIQTVQAAEILNDQLGVSVRVALAGGVESDDLHNSMSGMEGWKYVDYMGKQPREAALQVVRGARVGLVLFHPVPNHTYSQPNKLFEYMACGTPIVASDFPYWREIIERTGCGLLVDPLSPQNIAEAVAWLLDHPEEAAAMGERGRNAAIGTYSWGSQEPILLDLYARLLS